MRQKYLSHLIIFLFSVSSFSQDTTYYKAGIPDIGDVIPVFEQYLEQSLDAWVLPGAAAAIARKDTTLYLNCWGVKEAGKQDSIDVHTVFRIASVSKGFASILTGQLVEEKFLNWDDRVIEFLPDFALKDSAYTKQLTLRHLLSQSSGVVSHAFTNLLENNVPYETIISQFHQVQSLSPPGKQYGYQNVLYSLAGNIVGRAAGSTYADLVVQHIFVPLHMKDASLGLDLFMKNENRAEPHVRDGWEYRPVEVKETYYRVLPAAGVNASISDMVIWLKAMMGGNPDVISDAIFDEVTKPYIESPQELEKRVSWCPRLVEAFYGLGWRIYRYAEEKIIFHSGWVEGYRSEIGFIPKLDIGIVVLLNSECDIASYYLPFFFDLVLGLEDINAYQIKNESVIFF